MDDRADERKQMVEKLIKQGYLTSKPVIDAMLKIPRENFMPENVIERAYEDSPLPIGYGQTISAPHMVALMTEKIRLKEDSFILEIGSGSGYQAALLAKVAKKGFVYTIERIPELVTFAKKNISSIDLKNIHVVENDGSLGYRSKSPFDRILVTAAAPLVPKNMVAQLKDGGVMLIPVGNMFMQDLMEINRRENKFYEKNHGGCVFVPLIGEHAWP